MMLMDDLSRLRDGRRLAKAERGEGDYGRCAGCGAPAVLIDGVWINPGPGDILAVCADLRSSHGPFMPAERPSTPEPGATT